MLIQPLHLPESYSHTTSTIVQFVLIDKQLETNKLCNCKSFFFVTLMKVKVQEMGTNL